MHIKLVQGAILLLCMHPTLLSAQIQLTGLIISDSTEEIIPYDHVYIKHHDDNSFTGVVSDFDGKFTLTAYEKNISDTVTISYVGYEPMHIPMLHFFPHVDVNSHERGYEFVTHRGIP